MNLFWQFAKQIPIPALSLESSGSDGTHESASIFYETARHVREAISIGQLIYFIGLGVLASRAVVCVSLIAVVTLYQTGCLLSYVFFHTAFCFLITQKRSGKLILLTCMAMAISVYTSLLQVSSLTSLHGRRSPGYLTSGCYYLSILVLSV